MIIYKDQKLLLLRCRSFSKYSFVEEHNAISDIKGKVWLLKTGKSISSPKMKFDANKISFGGKYRYVARTSQNNGIKGYIDEDKAFLNDGQTISFGQDTRIILSTILLSAVLASTCLTI